MHAIRLHEFGPADHLVLDEVPDLEPGAGAGARSPSRPPGCTCSTRRCGAARRDRCRRPSCRRSRAVRSPASSTSWAAGVDPCMGRSPRRRTPRSRAGRVRRAGGHHGRQAVPAAGPRRLPRRDRRRRDRPDGSRRARARAADARRRGPGPLSGRRSRLAAGPGSPRGRCARRRCRRQPGAGRAAGGAEARPASPTTPTAAGRSVSVRRPTGCQPRLRRRRRGGRAGQPRAAPARWAARDVRLLGRRADPVRHRRRGLAGHQRRLEPRRHGWSRCPEASPGWLPGPWSVLAAGEWKPLVSTYPLAEAAQAHADLEARRALGKVVLSVDR